MRRRWLGPLMLSLASAAPASAQQAALDFIVRLDAAARQHLRLDAQTLNGTLGLRVDSECLAHLRTPQDPTSCWRDVSLPAIGWRGAAGTFAEGSSLILNRPHDSRSCISLAQFAAALPTSPQRLSQITRWGHQLIDGMEATLPVFQPRPTWRYPSGEAGRMTQLWVSEDDEGCVSHIDVSIDMPAPPLR